MDDHEDIIIVDGDACGLVPVATRRFEIHTDRERRVALYAFACPRCTATSAGGCREMIAHLTRIGVRQRELRSTAAVPITETEVAGFRRWVDGDPAWIPDD